MSGRVRGRISPLITGSISCTSFHSRIPGISEREDHPEGSSQSMSWHKLPLENERKGEREALSGSPHREHELHKLSRGRIPLRVRAGSVLSS